MTPRTWMERFRDIQRLLVNTEAKETLVLKQLSVAYALDRERYVEELLPYLCRTWSFGDAISSSVEEFELHSKLLPVEVGLGLDFSEAERVDRLLSQLSENPLSGRVRSLYLDHGSLTDAAVSALVRGKFTQLDSLGLRRCEIGTVVLEKLSQACFASTLSYLAMDDCALGDEGYSYLCHSALLESVTTLSVEGNYISDQGFQTFVETLASTKITRLYMFANWVTSQGVTQLANAPQFARFTALDLSATQIDVVGFEALANSAYSAGLEMLAVRYCENLSPELAKKTLVKSNHLNPLKINF